MRFAIPFLALCLCPGSIFSAPEEDAADAGLRRFTDKEGQQIEARVIGIDGSRRNVKIARADGRVFDLTITRLSLDDQQFLKEWLAAQPGAYHLEIVVHPSPAAASPERVRLPGNVYEADWEKIVAGFEISVVNRGSEAVQSARIEYCLLYEDRVEVRAGNFDPETETRPWRARSAEEIRYRRGTIELPTLAFNRPVETQPPTIDLDRVYLDGERRPTAEDVAVGVLVRVFDSMGNVIAEGASLQRERSSLNWELIDENRDLTEENGAGILTAAVAAR
ncbi:MAG: hypothetical protein H7A53_04245 [Akkermansiaceae bacterium]|nr:hypothetical protein [Akkermansiaceae bacterium]MCP5550085.1 hypothetical protein [Akkermansiaceae bacterium]